MGVERERESYYLINKMRRVSHYYEKNVIAKKIVFVIIVFMIGMMMYLLNEHTPLIADDYTYIFVQGENRRVETISDILLSQKYQYLHWGGRSVAHFIAQFFLLVGKSIFNIANTTAYLIIIFLIYKICNGEKKIRPSLYLGIHILIWFSMPVFGQSFLWLVGSCNYMWGLLLMLSLLYCYQKYDNDVNHKKDTIFKVFLMISLGFLAGWTNENIASATIVMITCYLIKFKMEKKQIIKWNVAGLISLVIGFITMIAAPGNYIRAERSISNNNIFMEFIERGINISIDFIQYIGPLIIITVVLLFIYFICYKKEEKQKNIIVKSSIFLVGTLVGAYAMILSPQFPERAWTGVIIFMIIGVGIIFAQLDSNNRKVVVFCKLILLLMVPIMLVSYKTAYSDIQNVNTKWEKRISYIQEQKEQGNLNVETPMIYATTKYCALYQLVDLNRIDKNTKFPNDNIIRYYGLKTITAK